MWKKLPDTTKDTKDIEEEAKKILEPILSEEVEKLNKLLFILEQNKDI